MSNETDLRAGERLLTFELYHENSKQRRYDLAFNRRIYEVNHNPEIHRVLARAFKSYPGAAFAQLPKVVPQEEFERVLASRRSTRQFTGELIELEQLARLLQFSCGITGRLHAAENEPSQPVRAVPSAGALYPVETYILVQAVAGLRTGLYHYCVDRAGMELLAEGNFVDILSHATSDKATFANSASVFILTGVFGRSHFKYGERGYRFALLEAGHICQNVLLTATSLGLGAVAVGGFVDEEVNALLDLDGVDEAALYLIAAGHPETRTVETRTDLIDRLLVALSTQSESGACDSI